MNLTKYRLALLLLPGLALIAPAFLPAQEPPELQLQFIQQLRKKGLMDLALEHIESLQKNPPPKLAPILPLEAARTRVLLAQVKQPTDRMKLLAQAQKELETYLATCLADKMKIDQAPQLKLEIARVVAFQGQALLSQALRIEPEKKDEREDYAKKARAQFGEARKKFEGANKEVGELLANAKTEKEFKKQLGSDLLAGKFDRAKTFIFEARSYIDSEDTNDRKKQAELYKLALESLEKDVALDKSGANPEITWLAVAWYIDVGRRAGEGQKPLDQYKLLMKVDPKAVPEVAAAQRLASYFYIQAVGDPKNPFDPPAGKSIPQHIKEEGTKWLNVYKKYQNTPEGQGVLFEVAYASYELAKSQKPPAYTNPVAKKLYDDAQQMFALIADSHSDRAEEANRLNIQIKLLRIGDATTIASLKDFDECFLKARYEMFQLQKAAVAIKNLLKDPPPDEAKKKKELEALQKKQKDHLKSVIAAFQRALDLTTAQTPAYQIDEVRFFLAYTYLISGDHYRAAVLSEYLMRKEPPAKQSPLAASYALQAYETVLKKHDEPVNRERVLELAKFVLEDRAVPWKDEPVAATARYSMAMFYLREKDFVKSIEHLEKLPKDFRAYIFAQCQLAQMALNLSADAARKNDPNKTLEYRNKALQTLRNITGKLPDKTDPATIAMYFNAQLSQGNILYNDYIAFLRDEKKTVADAKLKEMVKFTKDLLKEFNKFQDKIEEEVADKLEGALLNLDKYARFGETRFAYQAGDYDKVLSKDYTGDIVAQLEKIAADKKDLALPDYLVTGDLLGLALRAHVQKGNFKEAEKVLGLVQKLRSPSALESATNPTATMILQNLLADLSSQIKTLRQDITEAKDDKVKQEKDAKLKQTIKNFSTFFDALVKGTAGKTLGYNELAFLANSYASVDQHDKAAELYTKLEMPKYSFTPPPNLSKDQLKDAELKAQADHNKAVQLWWFMQVRCGEQWRLAKQFKNAKEVLQKVLDDPKAAAKLQAQKELLFVYEDEGDFLNAIKGWSEFQKNPGLLGQMTKAGIPPETKRKAREIYFDARYHYVYCWYMFSQNQGKGKEETYLITAANYIWKLELEHQKAVAEAKKKNLDPPTDTGWILIGDRLHDLMKQYPKLETEYKKQKSAAAVSG